MERIQSGIAIQTRPSGRPDENDSSTTAAVRHERNAAARPSMPPSFPDPTARSLSRGRVPARESRGPLSMCRRSLVSECSQTNDCSPAPEDRWTRSTDPMISSDSHIIEPPDLWERWLEPEFRPYAPKLVKDDEGGDAWLYNDGGAPAPLGLVTVTRSRPREELRWSGARYATINQGNFEAAARVEEMLEDGVVAEVIYSPAAHHAALHAGDGGRAASRRRPRLQRLAREGLLRQGARAADRHRRRCRRSGSRPPIAEMRRCKEMGLRGVLLSSWPSGNPEPVAGRRSVLRRGRGARHADQPAHRPRLAHEGAAEAEDADGGEGRRAAREPVAGRCRCSPAPGSTRCRCCSARSS